MATANRTVVVAQKNISRVWLMDSILLPTTFVVELRSEVTAAVSRTQLATSLMTVCIYSCIYVSMEACMVAFMRTRYQPHECAQNHEQRSYWNYVTSLIFLDVLKRFCL